MKTLIFLILTISLSAQESVIVSSTIYSIISGVHEYHVTKDRQLYKDGDIAYRMHNRKYHVWGTAEAISAIGVGITIGIDSWNDGIDWLVLASDMFLVGASRNFWRDGAINWKFGRDFFHQSETTHAKFEKYNTPLVKITLYALALFIRYAIKWEWI